MKNIILYITPALLLLACSGKDTADTTGNDPSRASHTSFEVNLTPEQVRQGGFVSGKPEERAVNANIHVNGMIDVLPGSRISVSAPLGGYLRKISLVPGARISKGSVLAVMEDQRYVQLQQDYLTARSRLSFLEADFKRQKGLNETKATSEKSMQQIQSEYANQRIMVRSLAEQLRLIGVAPEKLNEDNISRSISLRSPIAGYVSRVNANTGKYVNPEDVIFELIDPKEIAVSLTVFENDASKLSPGQKVTFTAVNEPGKTYQAVISFISPDIAANRTLEVHARPENPSASLVPGMFVSAQIELENIRALTLPDEAIVKWENKNYIFAEQKPGHYLMTPVETGNSEGGYTEIRSPLPEEKVVIRNAYTLLMKMKNSENE